MDPVAVFEEVSIATEAFAKRIRDKVLAEFKSKKIINVRAEGGFGGAEKPLSFTIHYENLEIRKKAVKDGEATLLEIRFRDTAVKEGYPKDQLDRILVRADSHQAVPKLALQWLVIKLLLGVGFIAFVRATIEKGVDYRIEIDPEGSPNLVAKGQPAQGGDRKAGITHDISSC